MKKILPIIAGLLMAASVHAGTLVTVFTSTNSSALITTNPATINEIQVYNPSTTTNALLYFYDTSTTNTVWTNSAYTNFSLSIVTYTNIYTNIFGVLTTNTYAAETNSANAVAASTNTFRVMNVLNIPPTNTVRSTLKFFTANGLFATNTVGTAAASASNLVITLDINLNR